MTITIYKETLLRRMQSLHAVNDRFGKLPSIDALTKLEAAASRLDPNTITSPKPIKRPKHSSDLSLFYFDGVPQVKRNKLGAGAFARTYVHMDGLPNKENETDTDHIYLTKVFILQQYSKTGYLPYLEDVQNEIALNKKLGRFIRYSVRDCGNGKQKHYVVTTYFPAPSLDEIAHRVRVQKQPLPFDLKTALNLMISAGKQLREIHAVEFTHGDLSTANLLITADKQSVLVDFNYSRPFGTFYHYGFNENGSAGIRDVFTHIAPECQKQAYIQFTPASDIYGLGYLMNKILSLTDCNDKTKKVIESYIKEMQLYKPTARPDLETVIKGFAELLDNPEHPSTANRQINYQTKRNVITALEQYHASIVKSYRSAVTDPVHRQKTNFMSSFAEALNKIELRAEFHDMLQQGFLDYFKRFVLSSLPHYTNCDNLGKGLSCLISAVNACDIEMNVAALIKEIEDVIPPSSPSKRAFLDKLSTGLSPNSNYRKTGSIRVS